MCHKNHSCYSTFIQNLFMNVQTKNICILCYSYVFYYNETIEKINTMHKKYFRVVVGFNIGKDKEAL